MRIYAIYDKDLERDWPTGYLFCYEKANAYIIELCEDLTEWEAPLLFQGIVKKGSYTIPQDISLLWVKERVIPSGRQNIGLILKNANLKEYNERVLLSLSQGKCSQDNCFIREVPENEVPDLIKKRTATNISECFLSEDEEVICLFRDHIVSKINLNSIAAGNRQMQSLLRNKDLLSSVKVGIGGYSIVFNDTIEIPKQELRKKEWLLPISARDFYNFVHQNIIDSAKTCDALDCSRQNLSYLLKAKQLEPIIHGTKENLYTKGSIQKVIDD